MDNYPLPNNHFQVEWGATRIGFQEVSGLSLEAPVIEYREGSSKTAAPIKLPGIRRYGDVTLKRGIVAGDNEIFEWFKGGSFGKAEQRDVTISLLNEAHEPVMVWKLARAWISRMDGPVLDGKGNAVAIEEMTLCSEEITVETP